MRQRALYAERQCDGKAKHYNREEARNHKKSLGWQGVNIYRCCFCGCLHVGRSRGKPHGTYKRWAWHGEVLWA